MVPVLKDTSLLTATMLRLLGGTVMITALMAASHRRAYWFAVFRPTPAWKFSIPASALGTFFGNPLSFPLIWLSTYNLGGLLLGREQKSEVNISLPADFWGELLINPGLAFSKFWEVIGPVLVPMLAGGLPLGLALATISYFPVKAAVETFQERRREQLFDKAKNRSQDAAVSS